jgi:hypothetical protein
MSQPTTFFKKLKNSFSWGQFSLFSNSIITSMLIFSFMLGVLQFSKPKIEVKADPMTPSCGAYNIQTNPTFTYNEVSTVVGNKLYVADDTKISVIDVTTNTITTTISTGNRTFKMIESGGKLYVYLNSNQYGDRLTIIDLGTNNILTNSMVVDGSYEQVLVGTKIYATNFYGTISVFDTTTNTFASPITVSSQQLHIFATVGTKHYIKSGNFFYILDTTTNTVVFSSYFPPDPAGFSIVGNKMYLPSSNQTYLSVFDMNTNTFLSNIPIGYTQRGSLTVGNKVYVLDGFNFIEMKVIDTTTDTVTYTSSLATGNNVGSPELINGKVLIRNFYNKSIDILDTTTNQIRKSISLPYYPYSWTAIENKLYVNSGNNVTVVDMTAEDLLQACKTFGTYSGTLTGSTGSPFPSFYLNGNNMQYGTAATLTLQGSSTIIAGTIQNNYFTPNPNQIVPGNVIVGNSIGVLSSTNVTNLNIPMNFTNNPLTVTIGTYNYSNGSEYVSGSVISFLATFSEPIVEFNNVGVLLSGSAPNQSIYSVTQTYPYNKTQFIIRVQASGGGEVIATLPASGFRTVGNKYNLESTTVNGNIGYISDYFGADLQLGILRQTDQNTYFYDSNQDAIVNLSVKFDRPINTSTFGVDDVQMINDTIGRCHPVDISPFPAGSPKDFNVILNCGRTPGFFHLSFKIEQNKVKDNYSNNNSTLVYDSGYNIVINPNLNEIPDAPDLVDPNYITVDIPALNQSNINNFTITGKCNYGYYLHNIYIEQTGEQSEIICDITNHYTYTPTIPLGNNFLNCIITINDDCKYYATVYSDPGQVVYGATGFSRLQSLGEYTGSLTGAKGSTFPTIQLTNSNLPDGTPTTLSLSSSTSIIQGTIIGGSFVPNANQVIPADVVVGNSNGVMSSANVNDLILSTDFSSPLVLPLPVIPLTVTINQNSSIQADPTPNSPVSFTAVFSEPIDTTSFNASDIVLTGTATGKSVLSITEKYPNNSTTFEILVATTGSGTIITDIPAGSFGYDQSIFGVTGRYPTKITIDNQDNIYVGNYYDNNITKITHAGIATNYGTTGNQTTDIAVDTFGNVYSDAYSWGSTKKILPDGTSTDFGSVVQWQQGITIDQNNTVYTFTGSVLTKTLANGTSTTTPILGSFGIEGSVDSQGNLFIVNYNSQNITKVLPDGSSTIFGNIDGPAIDIKIDNLDNVYVNIENQNYVLKFSPNGSSQQLGTLSSPAVGLEVDSYGNVYTVSFDRAISKISPDGTTTIIGYAQAAGASLVLDSQSNVYVSNGSADNITKLTKTQNLTKGIKTLGNKINKASTSNDNSITLQLNQNYTLGSYTGPLMGNVNDYFPSFYLYGSNVPDGTPASLVLPGTTNTMMGTIQYGYFSVSSYQAIPLDVTLGPATAILSTSITPSINIPTNFGIETISGSFQTPNPQIISYDDNHDAIVKYEIVFSRNINVDSFTPSDITFGFFQDCVVTLISPYYSNYSTNRFDVIMNCGHDPLSDGAITYPQLQPGVVTNGISTNDGFYNRSSLATLQYSPTNLISIDVPSLINSVNQNTFAIAGSCVNGSDVNVFVALTSQTMITPCNDNAYSVTPETIAQCYNDYYGSCDYVATVTQNLNPFTDYVSLIGSTDVGILNNQTYGNLYITPQTYINGTSYIYSNTPSINYYCSDNQSYAFTTSYGNTFSGLCEVNTGNTVDIAANFPNPLPNGPISITGTSTDLFGNTQNISYQADVCGDPNFVNISSAVSFFDFGAIKASAQSLPNCIPNCSVSGTTNVYYNYFTSPLIVNAQSSATCSVTINVPPIINHNNYQNYSITGTCVAGFDVNVIIAMTGENLTTMCQPDGDGTYTVTPTVVIYSAYSGCEVNYYDSCSYTATASQNVNGQTTTTTGNAIFDNFVYGTINVNNSAIANGISYIFAQPDYFNYYCGDAQSVIIAINGGDGIAKNCTKDGIIDLFTYIATPLVNGPILISGSSTDLNGNTQPINYTTEVCLDPNYNPTAQPKSFFDLGAIKASALTAPVNTNIPNCAPVIDPCSSSSISITPAKKTAFTSSAQSTSCSSSSVSSSNVDSSSSSSYSSSISSEIFSSSSFGSSSLSSSSTSSSSISVSNSSSSDIPSRSSSDSSSSSSSSNSDPCTIVVPLLPVCNSTSSSSSSESSSSSMSLSTSSSSMEIISSSSFSSSSSVSSLESSSSSSSSSFSLISSSSSSQISSSSIILSSNSSTISSSSIFTTTNSEDGDGVPTVIENLAANNGDGNNDGVLDSVQSDVASALDPETEAIVTVEIQPSNLEIDPCITLQNVTMSREIDNPKTDEGYSYPAGFVNFESNCPTSLKVKIYWYGLDLTKNYVNRKFRANVQYYDFVDNVATAIESINGQDVMTFTYTVDDNGPLDENPIIGKIKDPIGPAVQLQSNLGGVIIIYRTIPSALTTISSQFQTVEKSISPIVENILDIIAPIQNIQEQSSIDQTINLETVRTGGVRKYNNLVVIVLILIAISGITSIGGKKLNTVLPKNQK